MPSSYIYLLSLHDALPIYFGLSLGDTFIFEIIIVFVLGIDITYLLSLKKTGFFHRNQKSILIIAGIFMLWILLQMTLLRGTLRSEEHTSELQSRPHLVCRLPISTFFPYTTLFRSILDLVWVILSYLRLSLCLFWVLILPISCP